MSSQWLKRDCYQIYGCILYGSLYKYYKHTTKSLSLYLINTLIAISRLWQEAAVWEPAAMLALEPGNGSFNALQFDLKLLEGSLLIYAAYIDNGYEVVNTFN